MNLIVIVTWPGAIINLLALASNQHDSRGAVTKTSASRLELCAEAHRAWPFSVPWNQVRRKMFAPLSLSRGRGFRAKVYRELALGFICFRAKGPRGRGGLPDNLSSQSVSICRQPVNMF
ncbi:unnamed protein product [Polarella glacialis]|uniref:Uncharacterized protein n=1 Tax=Polarella glacialis TaxID=89957 RepID=A0A813EQP4_POLGL|nr:unnamed protein product [Polarella glacialis]